MNASTRWSPARPARTILLIAAAAMASVACTQASATGPGASAAQASVTASAAPSGSPAASPTSFHVALKDDLNSGATVDIVDLSGTLVGARPAEIGEAAPNPGAATTSDVTVQNVDATTLWIGWVAGNCPDAHELTIDATGRAISISQPPFCGGDTIGVGRQLVLTFSGPIVAADVRATLVQIGA